MKRRPLWLFLTAHILIGLLGCASQPMIDLRTPQYTRVGLLFFSVKDSKEGANPSEIALLTSGLGTALTHDFMEKVWLFDSAQGSPIADALAEHELSPAEIFADSQAAALVGREVGCDLVIIGQIGKLKHQRIPSQKIYVIKSSLSRSSPAPRRVVLTTQAAKGSIEMKLVNTGDGEALWCGKVKGHIWYIYDWTKLKLGFPEKRIRSDMWDHLLAQIQAQLFPSIFQQIDLPEIIVRPEQALIQANGRDVEF